VPDDDDDDGLFLPGKKKKVQMIPFVQRALHSVSFLKK